MGVGCEGLSSNCLVNRGEHVRSDVWGTNRSLCLKVEPNFLENISKYATWGKKRNPILGSFFSSASVFSEPKWQIAFGYSLFHFKEEQSKKNAKCTRHWFPLGDFFSVVQVSLVLVIRWHFTKNPDSRLGSIWNETANPATTDESCNTDCSYSIYIIYANDIIKYLKDLTSSKNCVLLVL